MNGYKFVCPKCVYIDYFITPSDNAKCTKCETIGTTEKEESPIPKEYTRRIRKQMREESPNPERYFPSGKFSSKQLGDSILQEHTFLTLRDSKALYYYDGEIYLTGETRLQELVKEFMHDKFTKTLCSETEQYIKATTYTDREQMELPLELIPVQNGILNTTNKTLTPFNEKYFITGKLNMTFDPEATCPAIEQFLKTTLHTDDIPVAKETIALSLYRNNNWAQKAVMCFGKGSNGKGVFLGLVEIILGEDNITNLELQQLTGLNRFASAELYHKYANICDDLSSSALQETGMFKMVVSGDRITAENKFTHPFYFKPYSKLFFSANELPYPKDKTDAFFRRWIIFEFPNQFTEETRDPNLKEKIYSQTELSGFLNVLIDSLNGLLERKKFTYSSTVENIRHQYLIRADPTSVFLETEVEKAEGEIIGKTELFEEYLDYCEDKDAKPATKDLFFKRVKNKFPKLKTSRPSKDEDREKRVWSLIGLKMKNKEEKEDLVDIEPVMDEEEDLGLNKWED